jgi:hypothetical protein
VAGGLAVPELNQYVWVGRAIELRDCFNAAEVHGFNRRVTNFRHLISGRRLAGLVGDIATCRGTGGEKPGANPRQARPNEPN